LNEDQLKKITYQPFDIYDMFPLTAGTYSFSLIVKNEVSKEFTSLEKEITIPAETDGPHLSSFILGYKLEEGSSKSNALFQVLGLDSSQIQGKELKFEFLKESEPFLTVVKETSQYPDKINFIQEFSLQKFPPGHYRIKISLIDNGQEVLSREDKFEITSAVGIPRPWIYSRTLLPSSHSVYSFIIGGQLFNKGEIEKAIKLLEAAYNSQPDSLKYALGLANAYSAQKNYKQMKRLLLPFADLDQIPAHYGLNANLLNSLGDCYSRLGSNEEALAAWEKSLEINANQPEILKKIKALKKHINKIH